jgi:ATP-dependent DNA helicase RecG
VANELRRIEPPTREVVANALCHRDYTVPGGAVSVGIYDDHLEIINTGTLHFDITPEKLAQPHLSRPWNPIIAKVFYRAGIIEQWGTGTLKVIDWCGDNANPVPIWEEQSGSAVVAFRPPPGFEQAVRQVTPEVAKLLPLCATPKSKRELLLV